ncbi:MAG: helicase-related protein, partial [Nitrososphaerota archaeon]
QKLFNWEYEHAIVKNAARNRLIALEAIVNRPSLVLVTRLEHGEFIRQEILKLSEKYNLNIKVVFLHGTHPGEERVKAMRMIDRGELDIAILSDIGKEGLDVMNIKSVILAAGQKSKVAVIQRAGRGLRPKKYGKVRIVDFIDDGQIVRNHSLQRRRTLKRELDVRWELRRNWKDGILLLERRLREKPLMTEPSPELFQQPLLL